jgi:hypothetical protein
VSPIIALRDYFRSEIDLHLASGGCPFPGGLAAIEEEE